MILMPNRGGHSRTEFLVAATKNMHDWSPAWKSHKLTLLGTPNVVQSLIKNLKYLDLSALSKQTHAALQALKALQNDGTGLMKFVEVIVVKEAIDAAREAAELVVITFALFQICHKIPKLTDKVVRPKELDAVVQTIKHQGINMDGSDLSAKILELRQ
jgi:hypothetical protein